MTSQVGRQVTFFMNFILINIVLKLNTLQFIYFCLNYEGISKEPTISSLICFCPSAEEKSYCKSKQLPCEIINLISVRLWNFKVFLPKINILKGNHCILRVRGVPVRQKLGMILENKVVQKLKSEKNVFYKKWSPKLIFLNDFFLKKFR